MHLNVYQVQALLGTCCSVAPCHSFTYMPLHTARACALQAESSLSSDGYKCWSDGSPDAGQQSMVLGTYVLVLQIIM